MSSQAKPRQTSLLRGVSTVSLMTFISRISGFIRDIVIARFFGATGEVDAFIVAFKIPNFMRRLFAEGAFSQAFVPILAEYQQRKSHQQVCQFIANVLGNLLSILLPLTLLVCFFSNWAVLVFAPGFDTEGERFVLASFMLKLTFPYLMLISLTALCGAILNTYNRFAIPALTPVLLNITLIFAALVLAPNFNKPIIALAVGVFLAGIIQFLFQLPFLKKDNLCVIPKINWQDAGVKRVLKLMAPALIGVSVAQINLLLDTLFASFLQAGSVSWLYFSDRLINFPLGVFGVAISTVILPHLSKKHAIDASNQFSRSVDWGMRLVLIVAIPSMLALSIFAAPLVIGLFAHGKFDLNDSLNTVLSIQAFSLGVPFFMLVKVLGSAFYAKQNIKTPVKIAIFAVVMNTLFCLLLIKPLAHAGLALASSLSGILNASLLLWFLYKRGGFRFQTGWFKFLVQLVFANIILGILLFYLKGNPEAWYALASIKRLMWLLGDVCMVIVVYFIALYSVGLRLSQFKIRIE